MSSLESFAALTARVVGMVSRDAAKAAIASCSREPCDDISVGTSVSLGEETYDTGRPLLEVDV